MNGMNELRGAALMIGRSVIGGIIDHDHFPRRYRHVLAVPSDDVSEQGLVRSMQRTRLN